MLVIFFSPFSALGSEEANYFTIKGGICEPDSEGLDTGFNGEIALGRYFNPNFALEFGIGYFDTDGSSYGIDSEGKAVSGTLLLKPTLPIGKAELFGAGGFGVYFLKGRASFEGIKVSDEANNFGLNLGLGFNWPITKNLFCGIEGKYIWIKHNSKEDNGIKIEGDLDGLTTTANIGFRF